MRRLAGVALLALAGCSSISGLFDSKVDYKGAGQLPPLEVPPRPAELQGNVLDGEAGCQGRNSQLPDHRSLKDDAAKSLSMDRLAAVRFA